MFNKKNQRKLTLEQKARLVDLEKEEKNKGQFLKEQLYPLLVDLTIEDAKIRLQTMGLVIDQAFMNQKREVKVSDLVAISEQFGKDDTAKDYQALYEILKDKNVNIALDLMNAMGGLITQNERQLNKEKKLSELPIRFITYDDK
jgi:hypothetical protein